MLRVTAAAIATPMTLPTAASVRPGWVGGGKGGVICDPTRMSRRELEAVLTRLQGRFVFSLYTYAREVTPFEAKGPVERQDLSSDLLADRPVVVTLLNPEVALHEIDRGQVRGGLAIRHRHTFQHTPALRVMRVDAFID